MLVDAFNIYFEATWITLNSIRIKGFCCIGAGNEMIVSVNISKISLFLSEKNNDWEVPKTFDNFYLVSVKKPQSKCYLELWNISLNNGEQHDSAFGMLSCRFSFNLNEILIRIYKCFYAQKSAYKVISETFFLWRILLKSC